MGKRQVINIDLLMGSIVALLFVVLVVHLVRSVQRRKALEQLQERYQQPGQALVRYVQLNRQCSEEEAYHRLATFVKKKVPFDEHSYIDRMLAHNRQSIVERAQSLVVDDPNEIDKI